MYMSCIVHKGSGGGLGYTDTWPHTYLCVYMHTYILHRCIVDIYISHDSFVVYCIYITYAFWACLLLILLRCLHHRCIVYIYIYNTTVYDISHDSIVHISHIYNMIYDISHDSIYHISHDSIVHISQFKWLICRVLYICHIRLLRMPPPNPPPPPLCT